MCFAQLFIFSRIYSFFYQIYNLRRYFYFKARVKIYTYMVLITYPYIFYMSINTVNYLQEIYRCKDLLLLHQIFSTHKSIKGSIILLITYVISLVFWRLYDKKIHQTSIMQISHVFYINLRNWKSFNHFVFYNLSSSLFRLYWNSRVFISMTESGVTCRVSPLFIAKDRKTKS